MLMEKLLQGTDMSALQPTLRSIDLGLNTDMNS